MVGMCCFVFSMDALNHTLYFASELGKSAGYHTPLSRNHLLNQHSNENFSRQNICGNVAPALFTLLSMCCTALVLRNSCTATIWLFFEREGKPNW